MISKFSDLINGDSLTLVDFTATWCGPCQTLKPILEDLKTKIGDNARIIKIDIDKNQAIAAHYNVRSVPTLILFRKGALLWRQSGVIPSVELKKVIDQFS